MRLQRPPPKDPKHVWGVIPHFKRVYEVEVDATTRVFHCSCRKHERTGIPCRHIACVADLPSASDKSVLIPNLSGFPLCSVKTFWWTAYYYYGVMDENYPIYDGDTKDRLMLMNQQLCLLI